MKKLGNRGFAISSILYLLIVLFLMLILLILSNLASRKMILDKIKGGVNTKLNQSGTTNNNSFLLYNKLMDYYISADNPGKSGYTTKPGENISTTNEGLIADSDNDGVTYYFRGDVRNNYVLLKGRAFRIMRINGDKSIRIISDEAYDGDGMLGTSNYDDVLSYSTFSNTLTNLFFPNTYSYINTYKVNYNNEFKSLESLVLSDGKFCSDITYKSSSSGVVGNIYGAYDRLVSRANPSFKCDNNSVYSSGIGSISADELVFAGAKSGIVNKNFYIYNSALGNNCFYTNSLHSWTSSNYYAYAFAYCGSNSLSSSQVTTAQYHRYVLNLNSNTIVKQGNGTIEDPYIIDTTSDSYKSALPAVGTTYTFDEAKMYEFTARAGVRYKLEVWGAGGSVGGSGGTPSKGGYSVGNMLFNVNTDFFIYVGGVGVSGTTSGAGGFNGGGRGYSSNNRTMGSGGGGTDVRLNSDSLYSRVIVAGGGGGGNDSNTSHYGGTGGGIQGLQGTTLSATTAAGSRYGGGGSQTSGGLAATENSWGGSYSAGSFGQGGTSSNSGYSNGAGGGWYGGGASSPDGGAGGGSGYIYTSSTASNYPSGCLLNSSYYLTDAYTCNGAGTCTNAAGTTYGTWVTSGTTNNGSGTVGQSGNGYVRITVMGYE